MNLGAIRTEVKKRCGNIQTSDIFAAEVTEAINRGIGDVIIAAIARSDNFSLFPELLTSWDTSAATTAGDNTIAVPTDKYTITDLASYDSSVAPNRATDDTRPMGRVTPVEFDVLDKTAKDWPRIWAWETTEILIWPTPASTPTDYRTYLVMYGLERETQFTAATADAQALKLDPAWHGAVVAKASYHLSQMRGWFQRAKEYANECDQIIARAVGVTDLSQRHQGVAAEVEHTYSRSQVYGR